jgi:hypothetical protein
VRCLITQREHVAALDHAEASARRAAGFAPIEAFDEITC